VSPVWEKSSQKPPGMNFFDSVCINYHKAQLIPAVVYVINNVLEGLIQYLMQIT